MLSHAEGIVPAVKGNKLRLEENVTPDLEVGSGGLNTTKAGISLYPRKVDILSPHSRRVHSSNIDEEVRELGVAGDRDTADVRIVLCTPDLAVVTVRNLLGDKHERGACIGNRLSCRRLGLRAIAPDGKARRAKLPEPIGRVDRDPGHIPREF